MEYEPLVVGTRLWRPVFLNTKTGLRLGNPTFTVRRSPGVGNFTGFALERLVTRTGRGKLFGVLTEKWVILGDDGPGLICFCDNYEIPENWTYFEVTSISPKGTYLFIASVVGSHEELLAQYQFPGKWAGLTTISG